MSSQREVYQRAGPAERKWNDNRYYRRRISDQSATQFDHKHGGVRHNSVYGCGDVASDEPSYTKYKPGIKKFDKRESASPASSISIANQSEEDRPDKRQRLLNWLKESQAKRDENNRQVFSRWVDKMDNMKAQNRDQSSGPTFYCDYLPHPHVLYSSINNYQGDATGTPTVYVGMSPFVYPQHPELVEPQLIPGTPTFINGPEVCTSPDADYFYQNNPRVIGTPCCFTSNFVPKSTNDFEPLDKIDQKPQVDCLNSMHDHCNPQYTMATPSTCCTPLVAPHMMNYASPHPMLIPMPFMPYGPCDLESACSVDPCGDRLDIPTSFTDRKLTTSIGLQQRFGKCDKPETLVPHNQSRIQPSSPFYQPEAHPCAGNRLAQICDPGIAYMQGNSPLSFNMAQWSSLLDDISSGDMGTTELNKNVSGEYFDKEDDDSEKDCDLIC